MAIELSNIRLSYYGKLALNIERLAFDGGLAVLGGAGAGKSNLIKVLAGTEYISDGQIFIGGKDVSFLSPRHRPVSLISANTPLFESKTVGYNLAYPLKLRNTRKDTIKQTVEDAAKTYLLQPDKKVCDLSKEERAAVCVCRALIKKPDLLLLDEPDDIADGSTIMQLLSQNYGGCFVYATYDYDRIADFCNNFLFLKRGKIIFEGEKSSLLATTDPYINRFVNISKGACNGYNG